MVNDEHEADVPGHAGAAAHHATDDHGEDHGHDEESLGPINGPAWGAGILGVLLGLAVAAAFVLATLPP